MASWEIAIATDRCAPRPIRGDRYEPITRSELPGLGTLDLDLLRRCILMAETDAGEAIRAFRREI